MARRHRVVSRSSAPRPTGSIERLEPRTLLSAPFAAPAHKVHRHPNPPPPRIDTIAPKISLASPPAASVSGTVALAASASDNVAVAGVRFLLDGQPLAAEETAAPYALAWDTNLFAPAATRWSRSRGMPPATPPPPPRARFRSSAPLRTPRTPPASGLPS
jgi:hypothetical protein